MKIWKILKQPLLVLSIIISLSILIYAIDAALDTNNSFNNMLWRQSVESQLKEQNDSYFNEIYDRYSTMHRDLNNYQYNTNQRLNSLENRVEGLEKFSSSIQINNTNTNINGDHNED